MRILTRQLELKDSRVVKVVTHFYESEEEVNEALDFIDEELSSRKKKDKILGFDTETTGLRPESEGEEIRLLQLGLKMSEGLWKAFLFDCWTLTDEQIERIGMLLESKEIIKVGQNLKFDIKFWKKFYHSRFPFGFRFGKIFDTLLAAYILAFGQKIEAKLQFLAEDYLGLDLPKEEALSDWSAKYLHDKQLDYAGVDAVVPALIREEMLPIIEHEKLQQACLNDFNTSEPVARLEYDGFKLNEKRWRKEYEKTLEDIKQEHLEICEMLPSGQPKLFEDVDGFNIGSTKQLSQRLALQGVRLPQTVKGNDSRDAFLLSQMMDAHPVIPKLIRYAQLTKLESAYGLTWFKDINKTTKRVHASFNINGAKATSRFSSFDPNLQQIPRGDSRRSCFEAEKGNVLVDGDYSQIELRILAQFSRDPVFIAGFTSGVDFHTYTAAQIFDRDPEDVTSDQREFAKRLNFGLMYGIGAEKLGKMVGISEELAAEYMESYFEAYKQTDDYLRQAAQKAIRFKKTYTNTGRYVKHFFDRSNKKQVSQIGRYGKNMPIQGTSAEILKRALQFIGEMIYEREEIKLVNIVHDEIILECPKAIKEEVSEEIMRPCMMKAGEEVIDLLPVKIDIKFMERWAK